MKSSQFLFKTLNLWTLSDLAGGKDILKSTDFLVVQEWARMRNKLSFFHHFATQLFPMIYSVGAAFLDLSMSKVSRDLK